MTTPLQLIDTHAHLDQDEFSADREAVLARAFEAGVWAVISIGVSATSSAATVELATRYAPRVFAAVGIHPNYSHEALPGDWDQIVALASRDRVVALGETGLDRFRDHAPLAVQQEYFARHLELSQQSGLPFIVHTRDSQFETLEMLRQARRRGPLIGVMHSFTHDTACAAECVELGMHISFAGMVTFKKSDELRRTAAAVPADRLLVETDSPYLSPQPLRGKRNEPAHMVHTAACLAEARGQTLAELAALTTANARRLFGLPGG